jgi:hypothetical protein
MSQVSLDTITVSTEEYERLVHRDLWLGYLEAGGVDNWDGYDATLDAASLDGFFNEDGDE